MEKQEKQIVEIDILSLLRALWLKKFTIVLGAVLFSLLAFGYSVFIAKKMYQSTTRIYVVSRQNETQAALTNQDLQAGSYLVKDFKEIILSQAVLSQAISELKLQTFRRILVSFRLQLRMTIQRKRLALPMPSVISPLRKSSK